MPARKHSSPIKKALGVEGATSTKKSGQRRLVTQMARGTLIAVGLAIAQADAEEDFFKKKFFEHDVVLRLHSEITRHHE